MPISPNSASRTGSTSGEKGSASSLSSDKGVFLNANDFRAYGLRDLFEPLFELLRVLGDVPPRIHGQF